ncbi:conserved hypothetical protein [Neospora caninum Liverpool]|nr:conserved hypothetical protein [Neospora caninum Liverpool]CBZ54462.1 conserved hypothetical protein [Neospora caninum Liverpool]|eukprot:XP_003884492.1 conserved hypothetical protein [Neospora caninum Liverpool]
MDQLPLQKIPEAFRSRVLLTAQGPIHKLMQLLRPQVKGRKRTLLMAGITALGAIMRLVARDNLFNAFHFLVHDQPLSQLLVMGTEPVYALLSLATTLYFGFYHAREVSRDQAYRQQIERIKQAETELMRELENPDLSLEDKKRLAMKAMFLREEASDALVNRLQPSIRGTLFSMVASITFLGLLFRKQLGVRLKFCDFGVRYIGVTAVVAALVAAVDYLSRRRINKLREARAQTRKAIQRDFLQNSFSRQKRAARSRGRLVIAERDVLPGTTTDSATESQKAILRSQESDEELHRVPALVPVGEANNELASGANAA